MSRYRKQRFLLWEILLFAGVLCLLWALNGVTGRLWETLPHGLLLGSGIAVCRWQLGTRMGRSGESGRAAALLLSGLLGAGLYGLLCGLLPGRGFPPVTVLAASALWACGALLARLMGRSRCQRDSLEQLLGRPPVRLDAAADAFLEGKTVLVTGGGGSIGSELCRQIAAHGVRRLVILDSSENNAYDIQQELLYRSGRALDLQVEIASIRDRERMMQVFARYRPEVVFHAAAHKHVPLMESSPREAVWNNVFGTLNVVEAAEAAGTSRFILISTDKAVNPTSVMGASKRLCEMILQSRKGSGGTTFAAVRFGNVLESSGSVVPLFRRQIAAGGPVTITDRRMIRYFMTIPEAAQLVLQAGAMARQNELYVLDMGQPVRILELAETLIRLSGRVPYQDIDIVETGLRPGEKLYEELLVDSRRVEKTENDLIFVERQPGITRAELAEKLDLLKAALSRDDPAAIREALHQTVPDFREPEELNRSSGVSGVPHSAGR